MGRVDGRVVCVRVIRILRLFGETEFLHLSMINVSRDAWKNKKNKGIVCIKTTTTTTTTTTSITTTTDDRNNHYRGMKMQKSFNNTTLPQASRVFPHKTLKILHTHYKFKLHTLLQSKIDSHQNTIRREIDI